MVMGDPKNANFDPIWVFPDCNCVKSKLKAPMAMKWHKAERGMEESLYCFSRPLVQFQGHIGQTSLLGQLQLSNPSDLPCSRSSSCQISRSHGTKKSSILTRIEHFQTVTPIWIHRWLWNDAQSLKQYRRGALLFFKVIHQISRSHGTKNCRFWPELSVSGLYLKFEFTDGFEMMHKAWLV